jgi:hypothetical protein
MAEGMPVAGSTPSTGMPPYHSSRWIGASAVLDAVLTDATPDAAAVVGPLLDLQLAGIPGARWASITQRAPAGRFVTVTASDQLARRVDDLQYGFGDGPCLRAVAGTPVSVDAGGLQLHWPEVAVRVLADTPVRAVLSQPLRPDASLNLYTDEPAGFGAAAAAAATEVAAACGLALAVIRHRARADNLRAALESSRRIGAAIGIVMALSRCTEEQAFEQLRAASQQTHRKLRDVADEILLTGAVPGR